MRRVLFALLLSCSALPASAKDDTPKVRELALSHPWHPLTPSVTAIELRCGADVSKYELRVDDRGWIYLIGAKWEAIATPFGRFLKSGGVWKPIDMNGWLAARDGALSLRELVGSPLLPEDWTVGRPTREKDATVRAPVIDGSKRERVLVFDVVSAIWMSDDVLLVTETKRFGQRMLPSKITAGKNCAMTRAVSAAAPEMPGRSVLLPE
jgi:hypothetical protein